MPESPKRWQGATARLNAGPAAAVKRGKIVAVAFALLALAGATTAWLLWPDPVRSPYFLAIWVNEYRDPRVPVSPWAEQDARAWQSFPWKFNKAFTSQQRNLLVQELRNLEGIKNLDDPVLVYLSAYALTDSDGKVALLPGDASLDDPVSWLPIDDVLKLVRQCPSKHKLLLLDLTQPFADAKAGVLSDDVAARLAPALKAATDEDDRLRVLTASAPGQVSLAAEDLGHSVFAYYLLQGLQGKADGYNADNKTDARVSLHELADYVTFHVDRWAFRNRKARQTPQLIGKRDDFHLVTVDAADVKPLTPAPLAIAYPDFLFKRWEQRDRWLADGSYRAAPRTFLDLEAALLRAEQQWHAGVGEDKIAPESTGKIGRLDQQRIAARDAVEWPDAGKSLALAVALQGAKPPDLTVGDTLDQLKDLTELYARARQPKPDDKDKEKLTKDMEAFVKKFEGKPFDAAWIVYFALAGDTNPQAVQIRLANELLRKVQRQWSYNEIRFLGKLGELPSEAAKDWPAAAIHTALEVVAEAEKVNAADPRALAWVKKPREQADARRRDGEKLLFGPDAASWSKARPVLDEALREYQALGLKLDTLHKAQVARDDALVLLPTYPPFLETDADQRRVWFEAVQTTRTLRDALVRRTDDPDALTAEHLGKLGDLTESLRISLNRLRAPFDAGRLKRLMNASNQATPTDWWEMDALLDLPWPPAKERASLWAAWRGVSARLQKESLDADAAFDPAQRGRQALPAFDTERAERQERDRAQLRAECSIALLQLAGADVEKLNEALALAKDKKAPVTALPRLGRDLLQAWRRVARQPDEQ